MCVEYERKILDKETGRSTATDKTLQNNANQAHDERWGGVKAK